MKGNKSVEELLKLSDQAYDKGNYEEAMRYCQEAAEYGNTDAFAYIGLLYLWGKGVKQDFEIALNWFQKVVDSGEVDGWFFEGVLYDDMKEYEKAIRCFETVMERDSELKHYELKYNAMLYLAVHYRYGIVKKQDYAIAFDLYKQAADNGVSQAMVELGELYMLGEGVEKNLEEAIKWYRMAADNGNTDAMCVLSVLYYEGEDVDEDFGEALHWALEAAKLGDNIGMNNMGVFYEDGLGDYVASMAWYELAASYGDPEAMLYIGDMYSDGRGVEVDFDIAKEWYKKALDAGCEEAQERLDDMK